MSRRPGSQPLGSDPLWYKDAVIYQLHVKAFADSSGDGIGDFIGLTSKLDYIASLGVTAIWVMPFYPSPLRDDGYDIADYGDVHPDYGTRADFRAFVRAAHKRGLRVITELVINHTSDQHPWFQRVARVRRTIRSRTGTCGPTMTRSSPTRGSSSPTPRRATGPGTRRGRPTTGIASSRTSRTSTTTTRRSSGP